MADNKQKRGKPDRDRIAATEPYEVNYFAKKHDISMSKAREIVEAYGPMRALANQAAEQWKKRRR